MKFYVVWEGRRPGVYHSWDECRKNIEGYPHAKYKSFLSKKEAEAAYTDRPDRHIYKKEKSDTENKPAVKLKAGSPVKDAICVDAACSGNPGRMEYRGVDPNTEEVIFHKGPYEDGTNNIGEFLAIVHALALLKQKQLHTKIIYSDSKIAIGWIKKKKCGTKLERGRKNEALFELIRRAENWLHQNEYTNPVLKWETDLWGEIPADFGRK